MDPADRRTAYDCDITYGTNSEFGFDYLRDNMKPARWGDPNYPPVLPAGASGPLNFAIIDEVDNILIDEARTPLIISGPAFTDVRRYAKADEIARKLTELERKAQELRAGAVTLPGPRATACRVEPTDPKGRRSAARASTSRSRRRSAPAT